MKRVYFILILILAISQWSMAQSNVKDVVYLKNGSIIKGSITELVPDETVKIRISDGSLFVYSMKDVERITKEEPSVRITSSISSTRSIKEYYDSPDFTPIRPGYKGFVEMGYTVGIGDYATNRFEVLTSHGFQFNPFIYVGGGTGFQFYHEGSTDVVMPLFANFRANFVEGKVVPFGDIKTGYSILLTDGVDDLGFYFSISGGIRFPVSDMINMNAGLGYSLQTQEYWDYNFNYSGITFKLGIEF